MGICSCPLSILPSRSKIFTHMMFIFVQNIINNFCLALFYGPVRIRIRKDLESWIELGKNISPSSDFLCPNPNGPTQIGRDYSISGSELPKILYPTGSGSTTPPWIYFKFQGSIRNRLTITEGKNDPGQVLLDENFVRGSCESPLYINTRSAVPAVM